MTEEELKNMTEEELELLHIKNCPSCNPELRLQVPEKCACGCED